MVAACAEPASKEPELASQLRRGFERASSHYSEFAIPPEHYLALIGERIAETNDPTSELGTIDVNEMYLAAGCALGDSAAVESFEHNYVNKVRGALTPMQLSPELARDTLQKTREKLLVAKDDEPPLICRYAGKGTLVGLVRTVAVRLAAYSLRRTRTKVPFDERVFPDHWQRQSDPELKGIKKQYRVAFKEAFEQAINELSTRERQVLRFQLVDGLPVDEIATIFQVHRTTVSRWLSSARSKLDAHIRTDLRQRLQLVEAVEFGRLLELIQSQLDLSVARVLITRELPAIRP